MDGEPVGLTFGEGALLAEPQVQDVQRSRSQAHGADASVLLRRDQPRALEHAQVLHQRRQRHRERRRELGHDSWGLRQPLHDRAARRIRESAEHGVELVVILRHTPNYYRKGQAPSTGPDQVEWSQVFDPSLPSDGAPSARSKGTDGSAWLHTRAPLPPALRAGGRGAWRGEPAGNGPPPLRARTTLSPGATALAG